MRPHRLRVQAFGPFAGVVEVDLDALSAAGLFLLHGETGAGKTTLLDAIGFALFGQVPGARGIKRLRSDHADPDLPCEVRLEVTLSGRLVRITRSPEFERPKLRGAGTTKVQPRIVLERWSGSSWSTVSTRQDEANAEIADLVGMSADQFFQVVLLPQGDFARFLRAKAEDRALLLEKLFGTDRFRAVEAWLADNSRATAAELKAAQERVNRNVLSMAIAAGVEEPAGGPGPTWPTRIARDAAEAAAAAQVSAAAALSQRAAAEAQLEQARELRRRQEARIEALTRHEELQQQATGIEPLRLELRRAERVDAVAPLLAAAADAAAEQDAAQEQDTAARLALSELTAAELRIAGVVGAGVVGAGADSAGPVGSGWPAGLAAATAAELTAGAERSRARLGGLAALAGLADRASADAAARRAAQQTCVQLALDADQARADAAVLASERARAEAARAETAALAAELAGLTARKAQLDRSLADAGELTALAQARAALVERRESSTAAWLELRGQVLVLRAAQLDAAAARLAARLVAGEPCPVCGAVEHPAPANGGSGHGGSGDGVGPIGVGPGGVGPGGVAPSGVGPGHFGPGLSAPDGAPAEDALAAAERAVDAADDARRTAEGELQAAEAAAQRLRAALDVAEPATAGLSPAQALAALAGAQAELADRVTAAEAAEQALQLARAELLELDAAGRSAGERSAQLAARLVAATQAETEAALRAAASADELSAQLGGAPDLPTATAVTQQVLGQLERAVRAAERLDSATVSCAQAGAKAQRAAVAAGFTDESDAAAAVRDRNARAELSRRINAHDNQAAAVELQLQATDLDVPIAPLADVEAATLSLAEARTACDAAVASLADRSRQATALAELAPLTCQAMDDCAPLEEAAAQAKALADLTAGLSGSGNTLRMSLASYVLAARLEQVAAAATERLLAMSAGRYSLVHTDVGTDGRKRAGLGLLARDSWTGMDRDTATLSGGETFLASLALALGLADVVGAEAGGARIDALFVDEGFGSLDEDALDEVMDVLDGLREGGRVVGLVSHVTELRQRIPTQLYVHKTRAGSQVALVGA